MILKLVLKYLGRLTAIWIAALVLFFMDLFDMIEKLFPGFILPTWAPWVVFLISFLVANGKLYIDLELENENLNRRIAELQQQKSANFELTLSQARFSMSGWANNMPLLPLYFDIALDLRNSGGEAGRLAPLKVEKCDMGTDLLGIQVLQMSYSVREKAGSARSIPLPYPVEAGQWEELRCRVNVDLAEKIPERFAFRLDELKEYHIILHYEFEEIDGTTIKGTIPINGSFETFKANVIEEWKKRNYHSLVYAAKHV